MAEGFSSTLHPTGECGTVHKMSSMLKWPEASLHRQNQNDIPLNPDGAFQFRLQPILLASTDCRCSEGAGRQDRGR